ncbi:MAG TPA: PAS domain S-box protein [Anaerolineales bacterium]|nr:PAS domain S-box protein [Anaerolineales bacterium]
MIPADQTQFPLQPQGEFTVLVIDPDPVSCLRLQGMCEDDGGRVVTVENGAAAARAFRDCQPDIVLLNTTVSELDACTEIQKASGVPYTPVLMITERDDDESLNAIFTAGVDDYVTKPIRSVILRQRVHRLLRIHHTDLAILRAKKEWEAAFDAVADMIILTDLNDRIIRCNQATVERLATSYRKLIGCDLKSVLLQEHDQNIMPAFGKLLERQLPTLPGWFEISAFPGQVEGRPHAIIYIFKDITERKQLEENLRENEQRFRALTENISEGILLCDIHGAILYLSSAVTRLTGYKQEVIGESAFQFIHPDDIPPVTNLLTKLVEYPETDATAELRIRHKSGSWIWLEANGRNMLVEPGIHAILINFKDATGRKQVELKLRQLSQAVEQSPISIVITDTAGNIEYVNSRFTQLTGYTFEEVLGKNPRLLKSGSTPPETYIRLWDAITSGNEWNGEFINKKKNGDYFIEWASISPVVDDKDQTTHFLALKSDITEYKLLEEALRKSEQRFRAMIENSADAVALVDAQGTITYITPAITGISGYPPSKYIGHSAFKFIHPEDLPGLISGFKALNRAPGSLTTSSFRSQHIDGSWRWVDVTASNQLADPAVQAIIFNFRDMTENKRAEETLRASQAALSEALQIGKLAYWEYDALNNVFIFNEHFYSIFHTTASQEGGYILPPDHYARRFCHPDDRDAVVVEVQKALNSTDRHYCAQLSHRILYADGGTGYIFVRVFVERDEQGRIIRYYGVNQDITEQKQTEAMLRQTEERLRLIVETVPIPILISSAAEGKILFANTAAGQLMGLPVKELLRHKTPDFYADASDRIILLEKLKQSGTLHNYDLAIKSAGQTPRWVLISMQPLTFEEQPALLTALYDVTERKQAEEALRLSEERFQLVTYATNDAIWDLDLATDRVWWNAGVWTLFGYLPEQIGTDRSWWKDHIHPDDRAKVLNSFQTAITGNEQFWSKEYRFRRADKAYAYVFDRGYIIQDEQGQPRRVIGAMMDLSERKRIEEALRKSEEMFSKAFHASPAPMGITRVDNGMLIDVNSSWEKLLGHTRQAIIGRSILDLNIYVNPEDRETILKQIRAEGKLVGFELKVKTRSEEELLLLMSAQVVEIQGQACLLNAFYDLTELRRMHDAMLASQKLADLGTLAAGVAHEMNSPLQVITGLSQSMLEHLAKDGVAPEQLQRNLDVIQRNGWRCAEIVRSLHTYARSSGGAMEPTDLNALISDGLLLIEHQLKSWANISVQMNPAENLPLFTCDRNQITQILINLLTNARDAMPEGGEITISTDYDSQADQLILQISDTGMGIPDSIQNKIFDPFFTTKPLGKGTGLGLSIVAGIVRAHGGTIEIQSAPRRGTTFLMRFSTQPPRLPSSEANDTPGRFDDVTGTPLPAAV